MLWFCLFLLIARARLNHRSFWFNLCCLSVSLLLKYLDLQLINASASQLACGRCLPRLPHSSGLWLLFASSAFSVWLVVAVCLVCFVYLACSHCLPRLPRFLYASAFQLACDCYVPVCLVSFVWLVVAVVCLNSFFVNSSNTELYKPNV